MRLYLNRAEYSYEMENVCRLFFPHEKFEKYYDNYNINAASPTEPNYFIDY